MSSQVCCHTGYRGMSLPLDPDAFRHAFVDRPRRARCSHRHDTGLGQNPPGEVTEPALSRSWTGRPTCAPARREWIVRRPPADARDPSTQTFSSSARPRTPAGGKGVRSEGHAFAALFRGARRRTRWPGLLATRQSRALQSTRAQQASVTNHALLEMLPDGRPGRLAVSLRNG